MKLMKRGEKHHQTLNLKPSPCLDAKSLLRKYHVGYSGTHLSIKRELITK